MRGAKELISFESSSFGWSGNEYAGMDWTSIYALSRGSLDALGYCDTGYNNSIRGQWEAFTSPFNDGYGIFESANLKDPFDLTSMIAASAWCGEQQFTFNSYTYRHGALELKASDTITISQGSQKIVFANYGKDFRGIAAVDIVTDGDGSAGSTCTYGMPTYGFQMAMDNVKVVFRKGIPLHQSSNRALLPIQMLHHAHEGAIAGPPPHQPAWRAASSHPDGANSHHTERGYHSQLLDMGHNEQSPISQFQLPQVEHFGC